MISRFFETFFDFPEINRSGEAVVHCPFPHDKGLETRPSAHINIDNGVYHCKTCFAEGRPTGFSELGFISHYYGISYYEAIQFMTSYTGQSDEKLETDDSWVQAAENLLEQDALLDYLASRGITKETAVKYQIGWTGSGHVFPVFVNGVLLDKRTYNPHWKEMNLPKITSQRGASCLLFPFDHWKAELRDKPTLLCAGEHDTLLARQNGFNAVTSTMGEGSFPQIFLSLFKGQDVYICYDCDEAGKSSARRVAFSLFEAGANVYIVDLGLVGTKDDNDLTDFFIKHNQSADDLYKRMQQAYPFNGELYQEEKNKQFPLIPLWDVNENSAIGKHLSSRVMMLSKIEGQHGAYFEVPAAVQWACDGPKPGNEACSTCLFAKHGGEAWWTIDKDYEKLIELVDMPKNKKDEYFGRMHSPADGCTGNFRMKTRDRITVQHAIFSPDVESDDELRGYRSAEIHAYVTNPKLEDGQKYRVYFKRYAHPKTNAIVMVVDKFEESDNAINAFKMTPSIVEQLSQFQGKPHEVMQKRFDNAKLVVSPSVPRIVQEAVDIVYHSVLDFKFAGEPMKGHPEGAIVGESRTGKSETAKKLKQFYGVGNHTELKNSSVPGLIGSVITQSNGGWRVNWGTIPRNHRGLLILDEANEVRRDELSKLTGLRSERIAVIEKAARGSAPAKTRLLWIANPRTMSDGTSRPIAMYPTGVDVIKDLFGSDQDIARLDFSIVLPTNDVYIPPFKDERELEKLDNRAYRNLIRWAWSRDVDQIKFAPGVEEYIWQTSQEMNELYDSRIKLFGPEAYKKIARISVSVAVMCFSHDGTGDIVLVSKDHVDYARDFLTRCYDNTVFRLREFVEQQRMIEETNEEVNLEFEKLVRTQPMLMKTLDQHAEVSTFQLQMLSGMERQAFSDILAKMLQTGLLAATSTAVRATLRFKKAKDAYNQVDQSTRMVPLSQKGRFF